MYDLKHQIIIIELRNRERPRHVRNIADSIGNFCRNMAAEPLEAIPMLMPSPSAVYDVARAPVSVPTARSAITGLTCF